MIVLWYIAFGWVECGRCGGSGGGEHLCSVIGFESLFELFEFEFAAKEDNLGFFAGDLTTIV